MNPVKDCIYRCTLARLVKSGKLEKEIGCVLKRVIRMPFVLLVSGVFWFYYGKLTERGPYWYFHYREGGKQRTLYVGKTDNPEAVVDEKLGKE